MYTVHTKPGCSYCVKAIELLKHHNKPYKIKRYETPEEIAEFKVQGFKTFPQIYDDNGYLIGGYQALEWHLEDL